MAYKILTGIQIEALRQLRSADRPLLMDDTRYIKGIGKITQNTLESLARRGLILKIERRFWATSWQITEKGKAKLQELEDNKELQT